MHTVQGITAQPHYCGLVWISGEFKPIWATVRLYLNPAGCGPNDGIFFSRNAYRMLDAHSIMPDKYTIRLEILSIGENTVKEDMEIKQ